MKTLVVLIGLLFFLTCEKEVSQNTEDNPVENNEKTNIGRITKKDLEDIDYIEFGLSNTTKKAVSSWASYSELETLIVSIKNANLSYFEGDEKFVAALLADLRTTIPPKLDNESVTARINALETKFFKLESAVTLSTTTKAELIANIKEFLVSFSNLNLQMNKKLEKEAQDISKTNL